MGEVCSPGQVFVSSATEFIRQPATGHSNREEKRLKSRKRLPIEE
jgi:hypothetical protein